MNRFVEGLGLGAGTMLAPTYVAENSPRAIRGFLVGFFQLFLVLGGMMAYFINYGALLHLPVRASHSDSPSESSVFKVHLLTLLRLKGESYVDGSARLSIYLPSFAVLQHALLPRVSPMACISRPMGKGQRCPFRCATSSYRSSLRPTRTT